MVTEACPGLVLDTLHVHPLALPVLGSLSGGALVPVHDGADHVQWAFALLLIRCTLLLSLDRTTFLPEGSVVPPLSHAPDYVGHVPPLPSWSCTCSGASRVTGWHCTLEKVSHLLV